MDKETSAERGLLNSSMAKRNKRLYDYLSMLYDNAGKLKKKGFYKPKQVFYHLSCHILKGFRVNEMGKPVRKKPDFNLIDEKVDLLFLSSKINSCIEFFTMQNEGKHYAFLYKCLVAKKIRLFNVSSENDILKLEKALDKNEFEMFKQNTSNYGNNRFGVVVEQDHIIKAIHKIGYDGLCSFDIGGNISEDDFHHAENVALFDPSRIQIVSREKIDIKKLSG